MKKMAIRDYDEEEVGLGDQPSPTSVQDIVEGGVNAEMPLDKIVEQLNAESTPAPDGKSIHEDGLIATRRPNGPSHQLDD